jgi:hypothetical protein
VLGHPRHIRVYGLGEETCLLDFLGQAEPNGIEKRIEISVKSGKDRVSTPSLVIHRVRLKKKPGQGGQQHPSG